MGASSSRISRKRRLSDLDESDINESDRKKAKRTGIDDQYPTSMSTDSSDNTIPQHGQNSHLANTSQFSSAFQGAQYVGISDSAFFEIHGDVNIQSTSASNDMGKYREWLKPCDPSANHNNALRKCYVETGKWLLEHSMYKEWKQKNNSFMWIHGISGAGKTVIFSTVVQDIQSIAKKGTIGLAYFYCDVSDAKKRNVNDILSSLVVHLLAWKPSNHSLLDRAHDEDCMNGLSLPSDEKLQEALRELISSFEMSFILIDGLDECLDWGEVLKFIEIVHRWGLWQCHLLVTSRKEQKIVKSIVSMYPLEIDMSQMPVDDDIAKYINFMLNSCSELEEWGPEEKGLIRKFLSEKAKGMFRWVACQLEELKKCTKRRKTLDYILESLPATLEGTYDQILSRIPPADASGAVKLLLWLAFANQPLHIDYLALIVEFDMDKRDFDPDGRLSSSADVLKICSSLVARMDDNTVQLAHASVKTYVLEKKRIIQSNIIMDPSIGDKFVGQCSLSYLLHFKENLLEKHSLSIWKNYQGSLIRNSNEIQVKKVTNIATQINKNHVDAGKDNGNALYAASLGGYNEIVELLLDRGADVNAQGGIYGYALQAASERGRNEIAKLLLDKGAYVNAAGGHYKHALQAASQGGHNEIVKLLLNRGAYVNAKGGHYGDALQAASQGGHHEIVKLLLDKGAYVNVQGGHYGNALQAASQGGHDEIVKLLLDKGADVNAQGGHYGNALQAASQGGHNDIVKLLLGKDADVNAQGGYYGNALQAASQRHNEIVVLLLDRGADVNAQGGEHVNALIAASSGGHIEIVKLLLERGADVSAQGGKHGNALQVASARGHNEIFQLFLERGADVNVQGGHYGNALQAASQGEHDEIVQILLERGADVNAQGGLYGNALLVASQKGHNKIVKLLLDRGADIDVQGGYYGHALQAASARGHSEIVQLLLEEGADVNTKGGYYGNSLQAASARGHHEVVQLLLEEGADVNAQGGHYGNALQAASAEGHNEIVQLLLEQGAGVNAQGSLHGGLLQAASSSGQHGIAQFLVDKSADVNAQGGVYGNPLQAALADEHNEDVQVLLDNIHAIARGGLYEYGVWYGAHNEIGKQWLYGRADVISQMGLYGDALQAASAGGHKAIVQLLLEKSADVNVQGGYYGNALQAASAEGHHDLVQFLIEKGADVNAQGGCYGSALQAASFNGHAIMVQILLRCGAEATSDTHAVEIKWSHNGILHQAVVCNALQAACIRGHVPIVKLLLNHGVKQEHIETAFQAASDIDHYWIVDLLLKHGAKQK
ncbi:ankyrin repeat-containing domain protein [Amanita rubescens]|nr:ankyrin repeat-containing domain protein [Amanita rubescens]